MRTEQLSPVNFANIDTPFYFYDIGVLEHTLQLIQESIADGDIVVHYAVKANSNKEILQLIGSAGFGADCVSYGEINAAIAAGIPANKIVFAGVGKTDYEISMSLKDGVGCYNVESIEELGNIADIASNQGIVAPVALRVNPNIDAHTHRYITTGLEENKFGISLSRLDDAVKMAHECKNINLIGLHFHIGSQILTMSPFETLAELVNTLVSRYKDRGIEFQSINVGGGLGIDYTRPDSTADFGAFFNTLKSRIKLSRGQQLHCELGRSVVAQCGSLISRVVYVKNGVDKKFVILDAGMNCLIRPALYGAHHSIQNLTALYEHRKKMEAYDIVGPICESSDVFAVDEKMIETKRGDIIAIRSAGAYGESMASNYNIRPLNMPRYSKLS
ncbi:MAG: diaminopimelate decarboxylase [Muribaculum sp.]|nr:diaminopimelate decarboxylase [Muribaculum sp.]